MAALSNDAEVYRNAVVAATGLDSRLVTAWIACESGWGITKAGHNYLNIGPGRSYPDVATAARDVVSTLHNGLYGPVLAAQGPQAQAEALKASPWDAGHYANGCLDSVLADLIGGGGAAPAAMLTASRTLPSIPNPIDVGKSLLGTVSDALDLDELLGQVLTVVVTGVFITAAFGIIVLGLNRLTANSATRQRIEQIAPEAAQVAALAAV